MSLAEALYGEAFDQGLRPDPTLTVSEWADRHRRLSPRASSEPGPWRTERTPYLREIMDRLSASSPVERVVVMKGAQVDTDHLPVVATAFHLQQVSSIAIVEIRV